MSDDMQRILEELREIKALIKEDLELDRRDLVLDQSEVTMEQEIKTEEDTIKDKEEEIKEQTKGVAQNLTGLKYFSLEIWRKNILENCESRISKEQERTIEYACKLYGGPCKFEICPKNIGNK